MQGSNNFLGELSEIGEKYVLKISRYWNDDDSSKSNNNHNLHVDYVYGRGLVAMRG